MLLSTLPSPLPSAPQAHVCVQQTALDLLELGHPVFLPVDGISSQRAGDRELALSTMQAAGAMLTTTESLLFMLMRSAEHPQFKSVLGIVKEHHKMGATELAALR